MRTLLDILLWVVAIGCGLLIIPPMLVAMACFDGLDRKPLGSNYRASVLPAIRRVLAAKLGKTDPS